MLGDQDNILVALVTKLDELLQSRPDTVRKVADEKVSSGYWLDVAIDPPPGLLVGPEKSRLACLLRHTDEIWSLMGRKESLKSLSSQQHLPVRFVDAQDLPASVPGANVVLWLSLGCDCLKTSGDDVERIKESLKFSTDGPRLLVVCMKYGAKSAAKALSNIAKSYGWKRELPVIWLSGDLVSSTTGAQYVANTIVPTIRKLLQTGSGLSLKDAATQMTGGASRQLIKDGDAEGTLTCDGSAAFKPMPFNDKDPVFRPTNADRFQNWSNVDQLQSHDITHVKDLCCKLEESAANGKRARLQLMTTGEFDTHARRRSVAMHVLECLTEGDFSLIIRFKDVVALEKEPIVSGITLMWLDLKKPLNTEEQDRLEDLLDAWDEKCVLVVLLTTKGNGTPSLSSFTDRPICDSSGECAPVSALHKDITIYCESESEGSVDLLARLGRPGLAAMFRSTMEEFGDDAFLAGIFVDEAGVVVVRVCITGVGFLHLLRDRIIQAEFDKMLLKAAQRVASGAKVLSATRVSGRFGNAALSTVSSGGQSAAVGAGSNPVPHDMKIKVDLTAFAEMYETSILRLEDLTPHQHEKLREGKLVMKSGQRLHIMAAAGAGKTFLALHLMLETLKSEPTDTKKARLLIEPPLRTPERDGRALTFAHRSFLWHAILPCASLSRNGGSPVQ